MTKVTKTRVKWSQRAWKVFWLMSATLVIVSITSTVTGMIMLKTSRNRLTRKRLSFLILVLLHRFYWSNSTTSTPEYLKVVDQKP